MSARRHLMKCGTHTVEVLTMPLLGTPYIDTFVRCIDCDRLDYFDDLDALATYLCTGVHAPTMTSHLQGDSQR